MARRAILHIGTFKTGSTSIQTFLDRNAALLETKGVYFPKSPGRPNHHGLALYALDEKRSTGLIRLHNLHDAASRERRRNEIRDALAAEMATLPPTLSTAVFSNEHLSGLQTDEELGRLKDVLSPHFDDIRIVVYLRRQDLRIISDYTQKVRDGYAIPFDILTYQPAEGRDYAAFLQRWAVVFGKDAIVPRIFSRKTFVNGDLIDDFLDAIGVAVDSTFKRPKTENPGLSHEAIEFLRIFNKYVPAYLEGKPNVYRTHLLPFLAEEFPGDGVRVAKGDAKKLLDIVADSNALVGEKWFGGRDPFPDDLSAHPDRAPPDPGFEDGARIAAILWNKLAEVLDRRQAQLAAVRPFALVSSVEARKFAERLFASDPDADTYFPTLLDTFIAMHAEYRDALSRIAQLEAALRPDARADDAPSAKEA